MGKEVAFLLVSGVVCLRLCFAASACLNKSAVDEAALLSMKGYLNSHILATNWSKQTSFCTWTGVICGKKHPERVTALNLSHMKLRGTIPKQIGNLTFLRFVDISNSSLSGLIPGEIGRLRRLRVLNLSFNQLSDGIPKSIGLLGKLQRLILSNNYLSGNIPTSLSACNELKVLDLSHNNLSGNVTAGFGNWSQLEELSLRSNYLIGKIPLSIGNLSNLEVFDISENSFDGKFVLELGQVSSLRILNLQANNLSGEVPQAVFNLSMLEFLSLRESNLSGTLPSSIDKGLPNIQQIFLGNIQWRSDPRENQFHGKIPNSISNLSKLITLDLSDNSFTHVPMNLGSLHRLQMLNLEANMLKNDLSNPEQDFISSLANCKNLKSIRLSFNPITGVLPKSLGSSNLSVSLETFKAFSCRILDPIPTEIGNLSNLLWLNLGYNLFTEPIPSTLGRLRSLQNLEIHGNRFRGSISLIVCNLNHLHSINLAVNNLSGQIPSCLGNHSSLREIYMSSNEFNSSLESLLWFSNGVSNAKKLLALDLSRNQLSGKVPSTISQLEDLKRLSLSRNKLKGHIIESFADMKGLRYLDLSHNNLTGPIPKSLEALSHLYYFDVSFNQLSGKIPDRGCFLNFSDEFFTGNQGLCGAPRFKVKKCKHDTRLSYISVLTIPFIGLILTLVWIIRATMPSLSEGVPYDYSFKRITYHEILRATQYFDDGNLIGKGSIGSVYKGVFDDTDCVFKVFDLDVPDALKIFHRECEIMSRIRHRNLVKIITCCSQDDFKALVMKYMPNGDLDKQLHSANCSLDIFTRFKIMTEVARAIKYLHEENEHLIVHCDVNPKNIILDEDMVAHVCDFGTAKTLSQEEKMLHSVTLGTVGYIAPEQGSQGLISTGVDVYSYGILLMEMVSRRKPTDEMFSGEITMRSWVSESFPESVLQIVDNELLITGDREVEAALERCLILAIGLALECTADLPEERPNMSDVLTTIEDIQVELQNKLIHFKNASISFASCKNEMAVSLCLHNSFHELMERHMLRPWRSLYDRFLQSTEERIVGIGYGVSAQYFLDIENVDVDFEEQHINAYLAILHKYLRSPTARVAIVDTMFAVNVQEIWMMHHSNDAPDTIYDSETMEDLSHDELQFLLQYVRGQRPVWETSSDWFDCDEVIVVCNLNGHWVVCNLRLTSCTITVLDSIQHSFTNKNREQRMIDVRPLARIAPVLLMHAGFWKRRLHLQPRLAQWPIKMPKLTESFVQTDSHSCGPFAMMYVEAILTGWMSPDGAQHRISTYRQHIAQTIFRFSTNSWSTL